MAQAAPSALDIVLEPLAAGVTRTSPSCTEGAAEVCDGIDADCDGRIDEGCGWESGPVQVTVAWQTDADLDLYVTDPSGFVISYMDRSSPTGGRLDHDARGACAPGTETIENVFWTTPTPPRGHYAIELHYWGECGRAGPTATRVSVSVGGRVLGVFDVTLVPGDRRAIAAFTL